MVYTTADINGICRQITQIEASLRRIDSMMIERLASITNTVDEINSKVVKLSDDVSYIKLQLNIGC
jgi:hypothetical protein